MLSNVLDTTPGRDGRSSEEVMKKIEGSKKRGEIRQQLYGQIDNEEEKEEEKEQKG